MTESVIALEQSMLFVYQDGQSLVSLDTSCSQLLTSLPQSYLATLSTQPCHFSSAFLASLLVGRAHPPPWHQADMADMLPHGTGGLPGFGDGSSLSRGEGPRWMSAWGGDAEGQGEAG